MIEKQLIRLDRFINPRRMAYAWIAGSALWIAWLLSVILGPGNMDLAKQVIGADFLQLYTAGMTVRIGESEKLYDFEFQANLEKQIAGPELVHFHAFITPPFFAYIFLPLSYLLYPISFTLWSILGLVCLYVSLLWLNVKQPVNGLLMAVTFFPVFASISFGQNSLLSLFFLTLSYVLWRKRFPLLAGIASSLLLYKPQLVLGIGLLWLIEWRRDWKALLGLGIGATSLVLLSVASMPEASYAYFDFSRNSLASMMGSNQFPIWHAHTWRAFWYLLFPGRISLAEIPSGIVSLSGLVFFLLFWKKQRNDEPLLFAAAVCLTLWISPHAMVYDWAIVLIPAIILWQNKNHLHQIWKPLFALLWTAFFLSGPLTIAQLKISPIAIQISLIVFGFVMAVTYKILMKPPILATNSASETDTAE